MKRIRKNELTKNFNEEHRLNSSLNAGKVSFENPSPFINKTEREKKTQKRGF